MASSINAMFVSGNTGEMHVKSLLEQFGCRFYYNIYFKNNAGELCQVDFLVLLGNTLITIEVKTFNRCVVLGNTMSQTWTACYRNSNKTFYNPVKQNEKHIDIIKDCLSRDIRIVNIVVFASGCVLKVKDSNEFDDNYVVSMSDLWYLLNEVLHKVGETKSTMMNTDKNIVDIIEMYKDMTWELSEEHQRLYFGSR